MTKFVVDTHALIWFLANDPNLGKQARQALKDPESELILPAIVLAEALWILGSRKLSVGPSALLLAVDADPRITIYPLTREIVELAHGLTGIGEMHDRQIVATTLHLSNSERPYLLVTKDQNIRDSGTVDIVW